MKLVACYLMGNCQDFVDLTLKSVADYVDNIVIVYDTSSRDSTLSKIEKWQDELGKEKLVILEKEYMHDAKYVGANGQQRNFYLDYLKKNHKGDWILCLDADEVAGDGIQNLKSFLLQNTKPDQQYLFSPKMIHFIQTFGLEDSTVNEHFVYHRLFNVVDDELYYKENEHPVLNTLKKGAIYNSLSKPIIYHLGYSRELFYLLSRYKNHLAKSTTHTSEGLLKWYYAHINSDYPVKRFDITSLPKVIKEHFMIEDDYFYFRDRMTLEIKHVMMTHQWKTFFKLSEPYSDGTKKEVLDTGCGVGHYMRGFSTFDVDCDGFDISSYAINNTPHSNLKNRMWVASVLDKNFKTDKKYELVMFLDILEHLNSEEEINIALQNGLNVGKKFFLFSIPFIGDANLDKDPTHKIKQTKDWWIDVIEKNGIKLITTPNELYYNHQLLVGLRADDKSIKVI